MKFQCAILRLLFGVKFRISPKLDLTKNVSSQIFELDKNEPEYNLLELDGFFVIKFVCLLTFFLVAEFIAHPVFN